MPSDGRIDLAFRSLAGAIERFRSAVAATAEEVRGTLARRRPAKAPHDSILAFSLGAFAEGRIDADRFARLLVQSPFANPGSLEPVEQALAVLREAADAPDEAFRLRVGPETRLRDAVAFKFRELGRCFAAARAASLVPPCGNPRHNPAALVAGGLEPTNDEVQRLGFECWSDAERRLAPPLLVELDGAQLHAGDLVDFLDGGVKIVLVVTGPMSPAPLVRLITPSTFVLQTDGATGLDRFATTPGPAVAAFVSEGAARFLYDPRRGPLSSNRLEIHHVPSEPPRDSIGGYSSRQQAEELEQLLALTQKSEAESAAEGSPVRAGAPPEDSVDRLAAWLLDQVDLSDL